jgi:hypothetical protein
MAAPALVEELIERVEVADLGSRTSRLQFRPRQQKAPCSGAFEKRMMGLEPTTFCMASGSWFGSWMVRKPHR